MTSLAFSTRSVLNYIPLSALLYNLCIILLILPCMEGPIHPSSRFFSVSQWRVNNSCSGCLLVEMNHVRRAGYTCSSQSDSSLRGPQYSIGGSHSAPPQLTVETTTTPSWLRDITIPAFTTVTREPAPAPICLQIPGMEPSTETMQKLLTIHLCTVYIYSI